MEKGIIFDSKEFAVYDGPGVRQTFFLKGCPLRCAWCHNPEGLSKKRELSVSRAACLHCGKCRAVCSCDPSETCTLCGACTHVCPLSLRRICGEEVTSGALAERILKNAAYYAALGGGVTFSGGEPLLQHAFLFEVLRALPGCHKAVETCGYAPAAVFSTLLTLCELVIMDIKLIDPLAHKTWCGVDNALILDNYAALRASRLPHIIRIPLIPGVNDGEENLEKTAAMLAGDEALLAVELLPYHRTAGAKYPNVNRVYNPGFDEGQTPSARVDLFRKYDLECRVL